jgi:trigger factor
MPDGREPEPMDPITMQVTETLSDGLKRQLTVKLPALAINEKLDAKLKELSRTMKMPGFRPGKVPLAMVKKRYGASVMGEILDSAVKDSSLKAMADRGIRPATMPKIEITAFAEGGDLEYTMAVELLPDVQPMDFAKLELEREKAEVTEAEVDSGIERLVSQAKRFEPVAKARKAVKGDTVVIDFVGKLGDVAFEGGTGNDFPLELGSNRFIPGFEDQLVGAKPGETRDVTVTFPAEYQAENLAGKEAVFTVTVKELREPQPVTVDDEFAKTFGVENLESLRNAVRGQIERDFNQASRLKLKRHLLDALAAGHDFTVPEGMVEEEFQAIWNQVLQAEANGESDDDLEGKSEEERKAEYRKIAERRVRLGLLLAEVGRLNNIQVTEDELRRAAFEEARRYPGQERDVLEYYRKTPEALNSLRAPLLEEKVVDFIIELAKITDRVVTPEVLFTDPDAAEIAKKVTEKPAAKKKRATKKAAEASEPAAE